MLRPSWISYHDDKNKSQAYQHLTLCLKEKVINNNNNNNNIHDNNNNNNNNKEK